MNPLNNSDIERISLHRGGTIVSSILGAFGSSLREDRKEGGQIMSRKARRIFALLNDPRQKRRLLESLNKSTLDEGAAPVAGGDPEMKVLKEMNELQELENDNWSRGSV
jgi:hypothetical protein